MTGLKVWIQVFTMSSWYVNTVVSLDEAGILSEGTFELNPSTVFLKSLYH